MAKRRSPALWLAVLAVILVGVGWWLMSDPESDDGAGAEEIANADNPFEAQELPPQFRTGLEGEAPAALSGQVTDPRGNGIGGAWVCAWARSDLVTNRESNEPRCVHAGPNGGYLIEDLVPVDHEVSASAPKFIPAYYEQPGKKERRARRIPLRAGETTEDIDITLESGGVLVTGFVKDISGGEIAGAWVTADGGWWGRSVARTSVPSQDDGSFELWVSPGETSLVARADGYHGGSAGGVAPGHVFELLLTPESVIVGRVVDAQTKEAVVGANIHRGWRGGRPMAKTGEDGRFRIERLAPGEHDLFAMTPEGYGKAPEKVHVGLGETSDEVVIELHPAFFVEGRVEWSTDQTPCTEGTVSLNDTTTGRGGDGEVNDEGNAAIGSLLPGEYRVKISCEGAVARDDYEKIVLETESRSGLVWTVDPGQAIRGIVVSESGEPLADVRVSARTKTGDDPRAQQTNRSDRTLADGRFELTGLLPGAYKLDLQGEYPDPEEPVEVELEPGRDLEDVRIVLPAVGSIEGIVRDEHGEPVANARIQTRSERWGSSSSSRDDGTFVLDKVRPGLHRVVASKGQWFGDSMRAPGTSDDDLQGVETTVAADQVSRVELVVESQNGSITGTVSDQTGSPVTDAFVIAQRESQAAGARSGKAARQLQWGSWGRQPVLTDQDGHFELEELAEGTHTVRAYRKGGGDAIVEGVELGAKVDMTLRSTGALGGVVRLAGGGHPDELRVSVSEAEQAIRRNERPFRTQGSWRVSELPPGSYEVMAQATEGTAKTTVELADGEEKLDIELVLEPQVRLLGRFVDLETNEPVAGLWVQVSAVTSAGGWGFSGRKETDERKEVSGTDGRWEVESAPTGKVRIVALPRGFGNTDYDWTVFQRTLPPTPDVQDLGDIKLVKRRTKEDVRGGDLGFTLKDVGPDEEWDNRKLEVAFIRPDGPAAETELQAGDVIVEIDGTDVTGENTYLWVKLSQVPEGQKVVLGVERGETITIVAGKPV